MNENEAKDPQPVLNIIKLEERTSGHARKYQIRRKNSGTNTLAYNT
jgi:hypothetical protein